MRPLGAAAVTTLLVVVTPERCRDQSSDTLHSMFRRATEKRRRRFRSETDIIFLDSVTLMRYCHEHGAVPAAPGTSERSCMRRFVLHIVIYNLRSPLHNVMYAFACTNATRWTASGRTSMRRTVDLGHRGQPPQTKHHDKTSLHGTHFRRCNSMSSSLF